MGGCSLELRKLGFILSWSSYSIMNPVYETDLRSLERRQILNSLRYVILVFVEMSLPINRFSIFV